MTPTETRIAAADGVGLFVRTYHPAAPGARKTIVLVHGAMEHGGRYTEFAEAAATRGYEVVVPDLRGHGRSEGVRCHVDCGSQYLDDLSRLLDAFQLPPQATALLGHSLGGLIAIRFAETCPQRLRALVATAPLLGLSVPIPAYILWLGRWLSILAPRTRFRDRIRPEMATRNVEVLAQRAADPLIITSVTARWYFEALAAIGQAHAAASQFRPPALVLQGAADRVTDVAAAERWVAATGNAAVAWHSFAGQLHELLFEPERAETYRLIFTWLNQQFDGP